MNDVFNITEKISKIEEQLKTVTDLEKAKLEKRLQKLKVKENNMTDKLVNDIASSWVTKEKIFKKRDYSEQSDSYYLIRYAVDKFLKEGSAYFNTDDIQYGAWEDIVPEAWQESSLRLVGDKKASLNKYFEVMEHLEDLFFIWHILMKIYLIIFQKSVLLLKHQL